MYRKKMNYILNIILSEGVGANISFFVQIMGREYRLDFYLETFRSN